MRPELRLHPDPGILSFYSFGGTGWTFPQLWASLGCNSRPSPLDMICLHCVKPRPLPTPLLLQCMKSLFEPFIWSIENNRDGDFSQHLVIV